MLQWYTSVFIQYTAVYGIIKAYLVQCTEAGILVKIRLDVITTTLLYYQVYNKDTMYCYVYICTRYTVIIAFDIRQCAA